MRRSVRSLAAVAAIAALGLAACTGGTSSSSSADAEQTYGPGALPTVPDGKLPVPPSDPAYSPWILNNDPASGEGYESAVIYALAEELGYSADNVQWVRATFDSSITPGAKDWDLNIQQFSITDERKNAVDFTSPYYTTTSAIITKAGTPAANAMDFKDVLIGVQAGTTSQQFASDHLESGLSQKLQMFNSSDDTVPALQTGRVDAFVVDLPTAFYMVSAQIDDGVIIGQFDDTTGGEEYGIVLPKGSKLPPTVSAAVDRLASSGKLAELQEKWLNEAQNVPTLK